MTTRTPTRPTHESIDLPFAVERTPPGRTRSPSAGAVTETAVQPTATPNRHRIELSATQLMASAFAAVTATVAGSFLGVTGTVIGAALASVLTVTGNAVYGFSLRRTHERVRAVVPAGGRRRIDDPIVSRPRPRPSAAGAGRVGDLPRLPSSRPHDPARRSPWRAIALASIAVFTGVLAVVTTVEVVAGRPLSDVLRGDSGSGTTLFGGTGGGAPTTPQPAPTITRTVTPAIRLVTPTVVQTAPARTVTTTPTATVPATPSPTTSGSAPAAGSGATASSDPSGPPAPLR